MSKFLDIESVRSKYSDITVTAVPKGQAPPKRQTVEDYIEITPHVEITRIPLDAVPSTSKSSKKTDKSATQETDIDSISYAKEYADILAKLETTKFLQTQVAMLVQPLPLNFAPGISESFMNLVGLNLQGYNNHMPSNVNIVKKYESLLATIEGMRQNIATSYNGVRAPKERLVRDIGQARALIRDCKLLLERDAQQSEDF